MLIYQQIRRKRPRFFVGKMERKQVVPREIISGEIVSYVADLICLNYVKQNSDMSDEDYEFQLERLRGNRDRLIYHHAVEHLRDSDLEGMRVQTLGIFRDESRLSDSFAHRYLVKTGFLGAVESGFNSQRNQNF